MRKTIFWLSVFITTFLLGYFVAPKLIRSFEKKEITNIVQEATPILPTTQTEDVLEEINESDDINRNFKIKLLETGDGFHGEQVNAKSGETWLNLFNKGNKFYLKKTKIKIQQVFDTVVDDENKKEKTGKTVTVANNPSIFLLKKADFLKEGEIESYFGRSHPEDDDAEENIDYLSLKVGFSKDFVIDGEKYNLRVKKGLNQNKEKIIALVLENNEISQTLHSLKYFDDNDYLGTLFWVGDLDRDKKPDFYLDLYIHDNLEDRYLFLSTKAARGKLVEKVANFWTNGC